jgi:WD40 repeat protein
MAIGSDGRLLASSAREPVILLWDVENRRQFPGALAGHTDEVHALAFSPDGALLASAGADRRVILWDTSTRRQVGPALAGHEDAIYSLGFTPDGKMLASAGQDRTILLWDVALASWKARACAIANRSLTDIEGEYYLGQKPDSPVCAGLAR